MTEEAKAAVTAKLEAIKAKQEEIKQLVADIYDQLQIDAPGGLP